MDIDIKRIGIGNQRFPSVDEELITEIEVIFTADSTIIYADSTTRKTDEYI